MESDENFQTKTVSLLSAQGQKVKSLSRLGVDLSLLTTNYHQAPVQPDIQNVTKFTNYFFV